jgi:3-ketosteroid 9alpha-monooxygenase subunit A
VGSPEWSDWSIVKWKIDTNCRELVDNQADMAHFGPVHGSTSVVYFANLFEGHKVTQVMVGSNERLGGEKNFLTTRATYFGPAYHITRMQGESQGVAIESILLNTHTPINQNSFELRFGVMVKKIPGLSDEQNAEMIKSYVELTNTAFGEDVQIWHNKVRIDNPLLCDGDGPIYQLRQWYDQFYMDADKIPDELKKQRIVENDKGVLEDKPPMHHVFEG